MRNRIATSAALALIRTANVLVSIATRIAVRPLPEVEVLRDDMTDADWLAMADGCILSNALRGVGGV